MQYSIPARHPENALSQWQSLLIQCALFSVFTLGAVMRFIHLFMVDASLPFHLGGLYVMFSEQILAHHFLLPERIPFYTSGGIPFVYPPLVFYLQAPLLTLNISSFTVINLLPPVLSTCALGFMWHLLTQLDLSWHVRVLALAFYALMPPVFGETIEASGLAEAMGSIAMLILLIAITGVQRRQATSNYVALGITWALCIVSSPGSLYGATLVSLAFLSYQFVTRRASYRVLVLVLSTCGLVSAPYWLTLLIRTPILFFSDVASAQGVAIGIEQPFLAIWRYFSALGGGPSASFLWSAVALLGLLYMVMIRQWPLLILFLLLALVPREWTWLAHLGTVIPAALATDALFRTIPRIARLPLIAGFATYAIVTGVIWYIAFTVNPIETMTHPDVRALEWSSENLSHNASLIVLRNAGPIEWAPQIARRQVLNEWYGAEAEPAEQAVIGRFNKTVEACRTYACFETAIISARFAEWTPYIITDEARFMKLELGDHLPVLYSEEGIFIVGPLA